jgi:RNA polymerase sigma-70 factor (ECF subfamily)
MSVTPDALLAALKTGDPQAVADWFKAHHRPLLRFVRAKISSETDAEEIVQETFINCLKHLPLFRGNSSIKTWMQGVARHEIADYYRKKYAKKAISALPLTDLITTCGIDDAHEVSEKVRQVFDRMSSQNRELLLLKYIDGKKVEEIAQEMGRTIKAVESELFRARQEFKLLYLHQ